MIRRTQNKVCHRIGSDRAATTNTRCMSRRWSTSTGWGKQGATRFFYGRHKGAPGAERFIRGRDRRAIRHPRSENPWRGGVLRKKLPSHTDRPSPPPPRVTPTRRHLTDRPGAPPGRLPRDQLREKRLNDNRKSSRPPPGRATPRRLRA